MPVAALPEVAAGLGEGAAAEGGAAEGGGGLPRMLPGGHGGGKAAEAPKPTIEDGARYTSEMLNPHQFSPFA